MLFEDYVTTAKCDRYNLMCSIYAYERNHKLVNEEASSGGVRTQPSNSIEKALKYFFLPLNFIESWLKSYKTNNESRTALFCEEMLELFQKIPVTLSKPVD